MANKVLVAYVAADILFVVMGAIMLGFSLVVQGNLKKQPTNGTEAVVNLLYSKFPLTGEFPFPPPFFPLSFLTLTKKPASSMPFSTLSPSSSPSPPSSCPPAAGLPSPAT